MEERQKEALDRLRASLKECTVLRAETYRDFIECQQEKYRLTEELKVREKEVRDLTTELKDERNNREVYHANY